MSTYLSNNPTIRQYQLNPVKLDKLKDDDVAEPTKTPDSMTDQERRARVSKLRKYISNLTKVRNKSDMHYAKLDEFNAELELHLSFKSKQN